jgi:hypothetical protein
MTSAPVTLLFTDLANSAELLRRADDAQTQRIFQAHHRLLKHFVTAHGGQEVRWLGDGWMTVFASPADAVRCAVAMQLAARRRAAAARLPIRVGLHVGETLRDETDYVATPVVIVPAGNGINVTNAGFGSGFEKCPTNEDVFIGGTDNLWRTTDFFSATPLLPGPTWSANGPEMGECGYRTSGAGCITALAFAASDPTCSTYAFATGDGRLRRTTNAGSRWDDLDVGNGVPDRWVTDLAFDPTNANLLYVTLSGFDEGTPDQPGHIFKTTSALAAAPAWLNMSPPVDQPQNAIAVDPVDPQVVYAGADIGVWKSTDGTWTHMGPESGMPNVAVYDLEIHPTVRRPFAFTFGRGAFVFACRSDAECDDQNAVNGVETCDLVSGRCLAGIAPPTVSPTVTPSATAAPSTTPTASATVTAARQGCVGDCSGTHTVAVNDVITLVNIDLGNAPAPTCAHGVPSGADVTVAVIIQAVNNALNGCGG